MCSINKIVRKVNAKGVYFDREVLRMDWQRLSFFSHANLEFSLFCHMIPGAEDSWKGVGSGCLIAVIRGIIFWLKSCCALTQRT